MHAMHDCPATAALLPPPPTPCPCPRPLPQLSTQVVAGSPVPLTTLVPFPCPLLCIPPRLFRQVANILWRSGQLVILLHDLLPALPFSPFRQLFKQVANSLWQSGQLEWAPGNWSFFCLLNSSAAYADVQSAAPGRLCDVFMNGVTAREIEGAAAGGAEGGKGEGEGGGDEGRLCMRRVPERGHHQVQEIQDAASAAAGGRGRGVGESLPPLMHSFLASFPLPNALPRCSPGYSPPGQPQNLPGTR